MPLEKKPDTEPIRGYRLLEPLGSGGFGEVWKCEAPGGIHKAVKFVYGNLTGLDQNRVHAEEELRAVQLIKSIRHPFLLSIDRVEVVEGELIIITELADHNLEDVLQTHRAGGRNGVPREEVIGFLREAAEVLDLLNAKFDLQHLDVKPRNLFLVSNHVKVGDFGLVNSLAGGQGRETRVEPGAITPLYAAPELFQGKLSRHCDQYSLAIVFQELLTGVLPFSGKNARALLAQHTQAEPDLLALPPEDRRRIARALAKNPDHRFSSCMDLIRALSGQNAPVSVASSPDLQLPVQAAALTDTQHPKCGDTEKKPPSAPALPSGVLAHYHFIDRPHTTPLSDVWKVKTPEGQTKLVQLLYGLGHSQDKLRDAVQRLRSLNHPALVPCEVVHHEPGRMVLLTERMRETLRDRFAQCQARKLPGIPRGELVDYLRAAAEVLDYLYQQHGVYHLGLNPRCLYLDQGWLQITEFGLSQLVWLPAGQDIAKRNARYAAPELFEKRVCRSCDQVSLAILYAEILTGAHPFGGGVSSRNRGVPDLSKMSTVDAEVIARALHADPSQRWPSCTEMVMALEGTSRNQDQGLPDRFSTLLRGLQGGAHHLPPGDDRLNKVLMDLVAYAGGGVAPAEAPALPEISADGAELSYRFSAGLPLGVARARLEQFHLECFGERVRDDDNCCLIRVTLPGSLWGRWLGRQLGFDVDIRLRRLHPFTPTPVEVSVTLTTFGCTLKRSRAVLEEMGQPILDDLRRLLLSGAEKRTHDRLQWPHRVKVIPVLSGGEKDEPIECRGKDISLSGLSFYLPQELTTAEVLLELPNSVHPPTVQLPATLVRANRCADGWYDVGALFRLPLARAAAASSNGAAPVKLSV
ncbi:MAG: protein kinase [Gemmataceae bacterium]|nr:protein kinase [Gemmataceae bacterium]MCI0737834.1 protein kinase [Gemmataceae bacterium]